MAAAPPAPSTGSAGRTLELEGRSHASPPGQQSQPQSRMNAWSGVAETGPGPVTLLRLKPEPESPPFIKPEPADQDSPSDDSPPLLDASPSGQEPSAEEPGPGGCTFQLLFRGRSRTSVFAPLPYRNSGDASNYEIVTFRRLKLALREPSEAARWAGKPVKITLLYRDDSTVVQYGNTNTCEAPLLHWPNPGKREFVSAIEVTLRMGSDGTSCDSFAVMAASRAHGSRSFELLLRSPGERVGGRMYLHTRTRAVPPAGGADERPASAASGTSEAPGAKRQRPGTASADGSESGAGEAAEAASLPGSVGGPPPASDAWRRRRSAASALSSDEEPEPHIPELGDDLASEASERPSTAPGPETTPDGALIPIDAISSNLEKIAGLSISDDPAHRDHIPEYGRWIDAALGRDTARLVLSEDVACRLLPKQLRAGGRPQPPPLRPDPAAVEALCRQFAAANDPALLSTVAGAERLVAALADPLALCTPLYQTVEGRHAVRAAFHNLREAGYYAVVAVVVQGAAASVGSIPQPAASAQEAAAAVHCAVNLLAVAAGELSVQPPDLTYLPWPLARFLVERAMAISAPHAREEAESFCRALYLRSLTLCQYGFFEASLEAGFEAWSVMIRSQLSPSRMEAAAIKHLTEVLLRTAKFDEAVHLMERLYYFDTPDPADQVFQAHVFHMRGLLEANIRKRHKVAIEHLNRSIEIYEQLPHNAYRVCLPRALGLRVIALAAMSKLTALARTFRHTYARVTEVSEGWHANWDVYYILQYMYMHPPESMERARAIFPPLRKLARVIQMNLMIFSYFDRRSISTGKWYPSSCFCLYRLGVLYLRMGANGKAVTVLEQAQRLLLDKCPQHYPPESGRQQTIAAALAEARARVLQEKAGVAIRPHVSVTGADVFGFAARVVPLAALFPVPATAPGPADSLFSAPVDMPVVA